MSSPIEALLRPRPIAVPGASADFRHLNGRTLKALMDMRYAGSDPVNPKCGDIAGPSWHARVEERPEGGNLAIVADPATHVPSALRALGKNKKVVDWMMVRREP